MPRKKQTDQERQKLILKAARLLHAGKSLKEVAQACQVTPRTISRWGLKPELQEECRELEEQHSAILKSDPFLVSVVEVRQQVQELLDYRDSQRRFALEMDHVVQKATGIVKKALERVESSPDEVSLRTIPPLMRAIADAAEKVSNAWVRAAGLDDLLETLEGDPKIVSPGQKEA